jgi:alkylation response protein AidB-like acyl-CoA dehydrogenase
MDLAFNDDEAAFAGEIRNWLADHLAAAGLPDRFESMDDEVEWGRRWQATLAADRWVGIYWPAEYGGRSASPVEVALFNMEYARAGAPQPVNRVGINLAGPTLLAHGSDEQKQRWLPSILDASEIWCQLFSEPDAGSDLASLSTRAEPVEDPERGSGWLLSGQKVWTSYAHFSRWGICLARTDPEASKHRGISYLVVDMEADGIEVRPLRQLTGEAEFNEVFLDDVFVPAEHLVGELNHGWAVANTTLAHERGTNFPFKEQVVHEVYLDRLYRMADGGDRDLLDDVEVSDALAQAFVELRILRLHNWRTLSRLGRGLEPGPESSWIKLAWTDMTQHLSDAAMGVVGEAAPLWIDAEDNPDDGDWQRQWLWSKAASIAGGTSEIQKTIIADRILNLPR